MLLAAPHFYVYVIGVIDLILLAVSVVVQGVAFVHCLTQRSEGFAAIGTLPKGAWLAILGIALLLTLAVYQSATSFFPLIGISASLIYLLDVRVGLRDLSDGKGFW